MEITTVSIIGLGALGVLFGHQLSKHMPNDSLRIVADAERIRRYKNEGVYCNGELCKFNYITPNESCDPADLLIFAVKFNGLKEAIESVRSQVGPKTIILSLLNGICSEDIIAQTYGMDKVLHSVAQGMDAVKVGNKLTYYNMGKICFGDIDKENASEKVKAVSLFFDQTGIPYEVDGDIRKRLWGKFMLNVGVNQAVAVFEGDYGGILKEGLARDTMIAAMQEVLTLSEREGVNLTQADIDYWLNVLEGLDPRGKPSMRQDLEAKRHSEVELFSGTVLELGKKHGLTFPTNQMLYSRIKDMESRF